MRKILKGIIIVLSIIIVILLSKNEIEANSYDMDVCGTGSFKSYMSMTKLATESPQYQYLINNTKDDGRGLRITDDGYYAVALGSYYGVLGDKFTIEFSNGTAVNVVKVDEKADAHTSAECKGKSMGSDGSIVEVITTCGIDSLKACSNPDSIRTINFHGNVGVSIPEFAGIESVTRITKHENKTEQNEPENNIEGDTGFNKYCKVKYLDYDTFSTGRSRMVVYIPEVEENKLIFLDTEFNEDSELVQASFIVMDNINDDNTHFFLTSSLNVYVNESVTPAFENFTGITRGFLGNEGFKKEDARKIINDFLSNCEIDIDKTIIIGHGIRQDLLVLEEFGIDLLDYEVYDTLDNAKRLLNIGKGLKLSDLLLRAGFVVGVSHDAYQDTRNLLPVFSYLKLLEKRKKGD